MLLLFWKLLFAPHPIVEIEWANFGNTTQAKSALDTANASMHLVDVSALTQKNGITATSQIYRTKS